MNDFFWNGGFTLMFFLPFGIFLCFFLFVAIRGLRQWGKNNRAPRLTVPARVCAKRTAISHAHRNGSTMTSYYATFEVESGDRIELHVSGEEFGLLVEGDWGKLHFQGTRFLGFDREA